MLEDDGDERSRVFAAEVARADFDVEGRHDFVHLVRVAAGPVSELPSRIREVAYCSSKTVSYTRQILSSTNCTNIGFNVLPKLAALFRPMTLLLFGSR